MYSKLRLEGFEQTALAPHHRARTPSNGLDSIKDLFNESPQSPRDTPEPEASTIVCEEVEPVRSPGKLTFKKRRSTGPLTDQLQTPPRRHVSNLEPMESSLTSDANGPVEAPKQQLTERKPSVPLRLLRALARSLPSFTGVRDRVIVDVENSLEVMGNARAAVLKPFVRARTEQEGEDEDQEEEGYVDEEGNPFNFGP